MRFPDSQVNALLDTALVGLQGYVVLFLLLHDWLPLGRLNQNAKKRHTDSLPQMLWTTLVAAVPAGIGLWGSASRFQAPYPEWLRLLLWITYGALFVGSLRAWWIPYLIIPEPERAERYKQIFQNTHRFLPEHNGIAPDTLHVSFHVAAVLVIILLAAR